MEIQVLAFNRFLNNRPMGSATLSLQRLLDESHIQLALSLIDINGRPLKVRKYYFSNFFPVDFYIPVICSNYSICRNLQFEQVKDVKLF